MVELVYEPDLVAGALEAVAPATEHWALVSSVSVCAKNDESDAAHAHLTGTVNAVGDPVPLEELLALAASVARSSAPHVAADDDWLVAHEVAPWAGPRSLPLWLPEGYEGFARRSGERYRAARGRIRSLRSTVIDTLVDERMRGLDRDRRCGLSRADELELIALRLSPGNAS